MDNNLGSVTALAELAKKIERQPGWRALADPELVADVYRNTQNFSLVEKMADGYRDPNALLRGILACDAADFAGDKVLAYIAKEDAVMAEWAEQERAKSKRPLFIVRRYFADGDGFTQYRDEAFCATRWLADRKRDRLEAEDGGCGDDEYIVVEAEIETE